MQYIDMYLDFKLANSLMVHDDEGVFFLYSFDCFVL